MDYAPGPGRVPAEGSQPRVGAANAPQAELPVAQSAGWWPPLDREAGVTAFIVGVVGLAISIAGLVAVALRGRR